MIGPAGGPQLTLTADGVVIHGGRTALSASPPVAAMLRLIFEAGGEWVPGGVLGAASGLRTSEVSNYLAWPRRALERAVGRPVIESRRGTGYRLAAGAATDAPCASPRPGQTIPAAFRADLGRAVAAVPATPLAPLPPEHERWRGVDPATAFAILRAAVDERVPVEQLIGEVVYLGWQVRQDLAAGGRA